jgi:hydroxyethylthiazole kinase
MKKTMAILLLLAMLPVAGIISAAGDSEASRAVAVDLFGVRGENTVWLGTAVPVYDGVVLASAAILPDDLSQLVITDGVTTWNAEMAIPDHSDMLMTVIYDSTKLPYTVTPFSMTDLHEVGSVSELTILAGDENMSRINRTVYSVVPFTWQSVPCLQASVSGPVEPGSLLITKDGKLVGIAVANWAEGTDKVVFITSDGMIQSMAESLDAMMAAGLASRNRKNTENAENTEKAGQAVNGEKSGERTERPIVIDPVGCASSTFRRGKCLELIKAVKPSCIRGNPAEIRALATGHDTGRGVDDLEAETPDAARSAMDLARKTGAIVVASGETDYIADGTRLYEVKGGTAWMSRVTGTGCMLSSLLGAFLAVENSTLSAAACCAMMNACAEKALEETVRRQGGTGTFHICLMDALSGSIY